MTSWMEAGLWRPSRDGQADAMPPPLNAPSLALTAHTRLTMAMTLAYLAVFLVGFAILGGLTLLAAKVFNIPLFGTMLLPIKLLFIAVLGFCVAYTLNDLLARFADIDLRDRLEKRLDR